MMERRHRSSLVVGAVLGLVLIAAGAAWYVLDPGFRAGREAPLIAANMPQDEFEQRIRDYLLANPEVIIAAVQGLEARRRQADESEAEAVLRTRAEEVFRDPDSPVGGNPQGDISLVEFFDYNCPYCRQVAPVMAEAEAADPELRVVYKEFPILGPGSTYAAKAALAAHRQGRYLEFHKALMQFKGAVDESAVLRVAHEIGLDIDRLKAEMDDPAIQGAIDRNLQLAQALRINGTPGFVIGDQILRGATDLETLQARIAESRARRQEGASK